MPKKHLSTVQIPLSFQIKKRQILADLAIPDAAYTDKSPKGSIDVQIRELIALVNGFEGFVTTSSCAGRVAVFVEGERAPAGALPGGSSDGAGLMGEDEGEKGNDKPGFRATGPATVTGPGGKGGGRWLYVSHDPIPRELIDRGQFMQLFGLQETSSATSSLIGLSAAKASKPPQLVHLSFSPLILHIFCATLHHARPLLAAAINAGFRESGIQSLKGLDDVEAGAMVAVRTAGLAFETVIGVVGQAGEPRNVVSEDYLEMCIGVVNDRFQWNEMRRERFRNELERAMQKEDPDMPINGHGSGNEVVWEDKEERRLRKREEGLRRRRERQEGGTGREEGRVASDEDDDHGFGAGFGLDIS